MKDTRHNILTAIYDLLDPLGLPVYSIIPDNEPEPFIYLAEIDTQELPGKDFFVYGGTVAVELYTGTQEYTGSLETILQLMEADHKRESF